MKCKVVSDSAFKGQIGPATKVDWGPGTQGGFMVLVHAAALGGMKPMRKVFFFASEVEEVRE